MNNNQPKVLYEDNHIIVVIKKPGVLSQEDNTKDPDMLTIIKQYIKEKYQKPGNVYLGLVHRLDRMTGGVMVFARSSKAAARLSEQIRMHQFEKKYFAVVHGKTLSHDIVKDYLITDESTGITKIATNMNGKEARLEYDLLDSKQNLSLLKVCLFTGRHHQIRVQMANRGYPLYGDVLYGKGPKEPLALYAYSLKFFHPITKELMKFEDFPNYGIWKIFELQK